MSITAPGRVSVEQYRDLMSAFPTGVSLLTSIDDTGQPRGMTCSSLASVTLQPPTLLVCVRLGSVTLDAIRSRSSFAVNLLHARGRRAAELFASAVPDRFAEIRWSRTPSGLPWLVDDAFAVAECRVVRSFDVATHAVLLGAVEDVVHAPDIPLLYGLRRFASWVSDAEPPSPE